MANIIFSFVVPTEYQNLYTGNYAEIEFDKDIQGAVFQAKYNWLPPDNAGFLDAESFGAFAVTLRIDDECLSEKNSDGVGPAAGKLLLLKYHSEVTVDNVPDHLSQCISDGKAEDEKVARTCNSIGYLAAGAALSGYSRLVKYAIEKRQIFPTGKYIDESFSSNFLVNSECNLAIDGDQPIPWRQISCNGCTDGPSLSVRVTSPTLSSVISETDLIEMKEFVENGSRAYSPNQFLVNAHRLWYLGQYRSSVLESYSAVETSINQLRASRKLAKKLPHIDSINLSKNIGITGSLRYLIPLAFPDILSKGKLQLLTDILRLGEIRQSVSHDGRQKFDEYEIRSLIVAAEDFCDFLRENGD